MQVQRIYLSRIKDTGNLYKSQPAQKASLKLRKNSPVIKSWSYCYFKNKPSQSTLELLKSTAESFFKAAVIRNPETFYSNKNAPKQDQIFMNFEDLLVAFAFTCDENVKAANSDKVLVVNKIPVDMAVKLGTDLKLASEDIDKTHNWVVSADKVLRLIDTQGFTSIPALQQEVVKLLQVQDCINSVEVEVSIIKDNLAIAHREQLKGLDSLQFVMRPSGQEDSVILIFKTPMRSTYKPESERKPTQAQKNNSSSEARVGLKFEILTNLKEVANSDLDGTEIWLQAATDVLRLIEHKEFDSSEQALINLKQKIAESAKIKGTVSQLTREIYDLPKYLRQEVGKKAMKGGVVKIGFICQSNGEKNE